MIRRLAFLLLLALATRGFSQEFRIARVLFEGNDSITAAELAPIAKPYENRKLSFAQLKELTNQVRGFYTARGYILARAIVPPQKLKSGGNLRVVISEGRYGDVKVTNLEHHREAFIRRYFARATRGGVVREQSLQRALLILNEMPDLAVRSLFQSGARPGTADVVLDVHDRVPFHVGIDYNNYGSPLVGRNRAGVALWAGNLATDGDELSLRFTEPFPSDSDPLWNAGYSVPVGDDGNRVSYSFSKAQTRVSGVLAVLDIRGDAEIHALTWSRPMQRTLTRSANVNAGLVFKTVENFVLGNTRTSKDDLRELTVGFDLNRIVGATRTLGSFLITQGLGELFGGNRQGDPESSRLNSGNEFTRFNADAFHLRDLGHQQYLLARASAQVATDPLAVAEQFALGGPDSVRGYLQSDFLGDRGFTTSLEYRRGIFTSRNRKVAVQATAFGDLGHATLDQPAIGEVGSRTFAGVGAGLRGNVGRTTSLRLDLGFPLLDRNSLNDDAILYAQMVSRW